MKRLLCLVICLGIASSAFGQNNGALLPAVPPSFLNASGLVAAGAKLCTTASGGNSNLAAYSDAALSLTLPNPITLNALGIPQTGGGASASIYLQAASYRITLYAAGTGNTCNGTAVGAQIWQRDGVYDLAELFKLTFATQFDDKVCHASQMTGTTAGAKIAACMAALPTTGGTVDARGFEGAQTISQNMYASAVGPNMLIIAGGQFTISVAQVIKFGGTSVIGSCGFTSNCSQFTGSASPIFTIQDNSGVFSENVTLKDFYVNCNSVAAVGILIKNNHNSKYDGVQVKGCTSRGWDLQDEEYSNTFVNIQGNNSGQGIQVTAPNGNTVQKLTFITPRAISNTAENFLINAANTTIDMVDPSFELGAVGLGITGGFLNINVYGGHFENNLRDVKCYKSAANSSAYGGRAANFNGGFFHGDNSTSLYAFDVAGCSGFVISGIYTERHAAGGGINFTNSGLTNAINKDNLIIGAALNETSGYVARDGLNIINQVVNALADADNVLNMAAGKLIADVNGNITIANATSSSLPQILLNDTGGTRAFSIRNQSNSFMVRDSTNGIDVMTLNAGGGAVIPSYVKIGTSTYSSLPSPVGQEGAMWVLTDANTETWGATVSAGAGTGHVLVRSNNTNWTVVGK